MLVWCTGAVAHLWDLRTSRPLASLPAKLVGPLNSVAFRPDGKQLALIGRSLAPEVLDVTTGQSVFAFPGGESNAGRTPYIASVIALSADGAWLAQQGTAIKVWDLDTGAKVRRLEGHTGEVSCAALAADGTKVLTGGTDGTVRLWDVRTVKP